MTTLPTAVKTPTTSMYEGDLATAVDGDRGDLYIDGMLSQRLHVVSPSTTNMLTKVYRKCLELKKEKVVLNSRQTVVRDCLS